MQVSRPTRPPPLRTPQAIGALALCLFVGLGGALITFLGATSLVNAGRLTFSGQTVMARVTDTRVMQGSRSGTHFEVRYAFSAPGDATRYTAEDETGRTDLWDEMVDENAWRAASATRTVAIEYLPSDPHVSRLRDGTGASFGEDEAAGLCLGLALLIPSILIALGVARGQMRRLSASRS